MKNLRTEMLDAVNEDRAYDFIANHYWEIHKEDLKNILLEYIYAVHEAEAGRIERYELTEKLYDGLEDVLYDEY